MVDRPAYRGIPRGVSASRDSAIQDNLEVLTGQKGNGLDKALTLRDLQAYGMVDVAFRRGGGSPQVTPVTPEEITDQPHAPENFTATGSFFTVILQWTHAHFRGYSYTEIYRSATNDFGTAIRIGTEIGTFFVDDVGLDASFYYWAQFVNTADIKGPINATAGTYAETAPNISQVMQDMSDTINSGLLAAELAARINLIDTPNTGLVDGLHNEQVSRVQGQNNLQQQIDSIAVGFAVNAFYQATEPTALESEEGDRWFDTDDGNHPYLYVAGVWVDVSDQRILNNQAAIQSEQTARISADDAQSTRINTLFANIEDPDTGLIANALAYDNLSATVTFLGESISANTTELNQIQAIVGPDYASLQTIKSVTIDPGGMTAQYVLKTDVNGYIAGFGLWNTGATSQFLVNADTFAVGKAGAVSKYPFIIQGGVVYIDVAMIANASITDAKIGTLSADKITAGILNAARLAANSITADKIDSRGLSIKDQNGNVILSSGQQLSAGYISGLGSLALLNSVTWGQNISGQPADAAILNSAIKLGKNYVRGFRAWLHGGANWTYTGSPNAVDGSSLVIPAASVGQASSSPNLGLWAGFSSRVSFRALTYSGTRTLRIDFFPDTLPETAVTLTPTITEFSFNFTSSHANMSSAILRFFADAGDQIEIFDVKVELDNYGAKTPWTPHALDSIGIANPITAANISTFIAAAAIGTAFIQNAAIVNALIADAAISTAKIGDAAVNTLKLADQSVVIRVAASSTAAVGLPNDNSYILVASKSITMDNATSSSSITVDFDYAISFGQSGHSGNYVFVVQRNGVTILSQSTTAGFTPSAASRNYKTVDYPGAGTHTYSFFFSQGDNNNARVTSYFLALDGAKK